MAATASTTVIAINTSSRLGSVGTQGHARRGRQEGYGDSLFELGQRSDMAAEEERGGVLYYGDNLESSVATRKTSRSISSTSTRRSTRRKTTTFSSGNDGARSAAQVKAFKDTWEWDEAAARSYHELVEAGGKVSEAMQAFRLVVGETDMLAYLSMMAPRLIELHRVMKPTASIYLHCDPVARATT